MKIKKAIDRIPGGLMLVPLLLGACVHTFSPHAGKFFGQAVAPAATALVATSVVVTSLLTPILTAIWARRWGVLSTNYRRTHPASPEPLRDNSDGLEATLQPPLK